MRKNDANDKSLPYKVKYIQIPDRPDIYAVFYVQKNTLCLNRCFSGGTKVIVMQQKR